jgi:hypothetical protein
MKLATAMAAAAATDSLVTSQQLQACGRMINRFV